jgi:hypothetical protein
MKKILFVILIFYSISGYCQTDSSKTKISLSIAAKDCEYISLKFEKSNKFEDIDSTVKRKFRDPGGAPTNNTSVQLDSIEVRVWRDIMNDLRFDIIAVHENVYKRISDALISNGNTWIVNKLSKDFEPIDAQYDDLRTLGRKYLKKEQD